jgi:hypothetical protein
MPPLPPKFQKYSQIKVGTHYFYRDNFKKINKNKGRNTSDAKVWISTLKPRMRQKMQPAVLLEVSKFLEDKLRSLDVWNDHTTIVPC